MGLRSVLMLVAVVALACGGQATKDSSDGGRQGSSGGSGSGGSSGGGSGGGSGGSSGSPNPCPNFQSVGACAPAPGAVCAGSNPINGCGLDALPSGLACSGGAQCSLIIYPCPDWQQYVGGERTDGYICTCVNSRWSCDDCAPGGAECAEAGAPLDASPVSDSSAAITCTPPVYNGGSSGGGNTAMGLKETCSDGNTYETYCTCPYGECSCTEIYSDGGYNMVPYVPYSCGNGGTFAACGYPGAQ